MISPIGARGATVVVMSGGVDSSVAAALFSRESPNVIGVTLRLWSGATEQRRGAAPGQAALFCDDAAEPELLLGGGAVCRPGRGTDASGERAGLTWSRHG